MSEAAGTIRGDLLRWARNQRAFTMRELSGRTGIALAFLSEVETGKKSDVSQARLVPWIKALGVTQAFVRGRVPRYLENPVACRGLAADCIGRIHRDLEDETWTRLSVAARCSKVLSLITEHCESLPRLVLAYVLGLSLESLEGYLQGNLQVPPRYLVTAIADITGIPETAFHGAYTPFSQHERVLHELLPAIQMALRAKVTPEELKELIYQTACNHALRHQEGSAMEQDLSPCAPTGQ